MRSHSHAACRWADSEELSEDEDLWAEMREFWSDGEEVDGVSRAPARRARKGPRKPRAPGQLRGGGQAYSKLRHQIVTHYNAVTQVCMHGGLLHFAHGTFLPLPSEIPNDYSRMQNHHGNKRRLPCLSCMLYSLA